MAHFFDFTDMVGMPALSLKEKYFYPSKFTGIFDSRSLVVTLSDLNDLEGLKEQLKTKELSGGNIYFDLQDFYANLNGLQEVLDVIKQHSDANQNTKFMVVNGNYNHFSAYQLAGLTEFEKQIEKTFSTPEDFRLQKKRNMAKLTFPFIDLHNSLPLEIKTGVSYNLQEVKHSSMIVNSVISDIKNANLSPYEAYLAAYAWITSFEYNVTGTLRKLNKNGHVIEIAKDFSNIKTMKGKDNLPYEKDPTLSRDIPAVLKTGFIVCVAYSNLLALICSELGIKTFTEIYLAHENEVVNGKNKRTNISHERTLVMIEDEKYGLKNGVFNADITQDSFYYGQGDFIKFIHNLIPLTTDNYDETSVISKLARGKGFSEEEEETQDDLYYRLVESGFIEAKLPLLRHEDYVLLKEYKETGENPLSETYNFLFNRTGRIENYVSELEKESNILAADYFKHLDGVEQERKRGYSEFYEKAKTTDPIAQHKFYEALKNIVPLIKPGVDPEDFANWLMNENIIAVKDVNIISPTFADLKQYKVKGKYMGGYYVDETYDVKESEDQNLLTEYEKMMNNKNKELSEQESENGREM